jgi:homopolymeric O-antigen transport system permease protein
MATIVHRSDSELRHPRQFLTGLWDDMRASRHLMWRLFVRDVSAQYRYTLLGVAWAFVPPLALALGAMLAKDARLLNVGPTDIPYPAFAMLGTVLWQTFVESLNGPLEALTRARPMLARIRFPREAIILAKVGEVLFNFSIKLVLLALVFLWFSLPVGWTLLLALVPVVELVLLGTLVGLLVAPFAALYMDVAKMLALATGLWFFLTPVLYPVPAHGAFGTLVRLNPVTPVLLTARDLATAGVTTQLPAFVVVSTTTVLGLAVTWVICRLALPFVIERAGS